MERHYVSLAVLGKPYSTAERKGKRSSVAMTAPIALPGEKVMVSNYKRKGQWEEAEVRMVKSDWSIDPDNQRAYVYHQYSVILDRKSDSDKYMWLYVGDGAIQKL